MTDLEEGLHKGQTIPVGTRNGLVSLIVGVYNVEEYLPKCLESISCQTYDNLEILLIDDGSEDGSGAICDAFAAKDSRTRVIHQKNHGLWAVRNRGQAESKGEYLAFIDGDDYFHKDYIRLLHEAINKDGHRYPLSICGYERASDDSEDISSDINPKMLEMDRTLLIEQFFSSDHCTYAANWNKLYRKDSIESPFQKDYLRCQDMDSNLHAFLTTIDHAIKVEHTLYYWRIRPGQLTGAVNDQSIRNCCRSLIFCDNHFNLSGDMKAFDHYLLMALYRRMTRWMNSSMEGDERREAIATIKEIKRKTAFDFLFCEHEPFSYKLGLLLSLDFPFSSKVLLSIKKAFISPLGTTK